MRDFVGVEVTRLILKSQRLLTSSPRVIHGTERMRQKLFVVASGALVNTSAPNEPAALVAVSV